MEAIVEYNYMAQEPDELTIKKGDIIKDIKVLIGGWWEGTLRDKRGMFPDNFVKILEPKEDQKCGESSSTVKSEEVTIRNGPGRKFCKVLFSYDPCNDDELRLIPEELIEYLGEVEEGWWRGRLKGRIGVFPSNFVTPPVTEEADKNKTKNNFEICRVLFPYEAANEDELTLIEGDLITLLSKQAPDKGWWKGELNGRIGLFPDNFVEVINLNNEQLPLHQLSSQFLQTDECNQILSGKSSLKNNIGKKVEKANVRKSLDSKVANSDSTSKKVNHSSNTTISANQTDGTTGRQNEKKSGNSISNIKKLIVGDNTNNGHGTLELGLGEELDEVERGEVPLNHLTTTRAKAPRRRLPSSQHLKHSVVNVPPPNYPGITEGQNIINGNTDNPMELSPKEDENDGLQTKSRKKAPWVEELKLNQLERKKVGADRLDKADIKNERHSWLQNSTENIVKTDTDNEVKFKDKDTEKDLDREKDKDKMKLNSKQDCDFSNMNNPSNAMAYVPYSCFAQVLDRISALEEKNSILQHTVHQLSDQLSTLLANKN